MSSSYLCQPDWMREAIQALLKREDVNSVSCPFLDPEIWRILIAEQVKRAKATGLPAREALFLCGCSNEIESLPISAWGGDVHIPYDGISGADLFIVPEWHKVNSELPLRGGRLCSAVLGKRCHHLLLSKDYGDWRRATRQAVGTWYLYSSTDPYVKSHPDDDPSFYGMGWRPHLEELQE